MIVSDPRVKKLLVSLIIEMYKMNEISNQTFRAVLEEVGINMDDYFQELWSYENSSSFSGLAFSDSGNLAVSSYDKCYYVFDPNGNLLNKVCGNSIMMDTSYCCGKFGFINHDGYAYIANEDGTPWKKINVGYYYDNSIALLSDSFIACALRCAYFDFNGNKKWDISITNIGRVYTNPTVYEDYVYIPIIGDDSSKVSIRRLSDGGEVYSLGYGDKVSDVKICKNNLAVLTEHHLYLYNLDKPNVPKFLRMIGSFTTSIRVAFSPDCNYIAITDLNGGRLVIFNPEGFRVFEKDCQFPACVAWWKDRIAFTALYEPGKYKVYVHRFNWDLDKIKSLLLGY